MDSRARASCASSLYASADSVAATRDDAPSGDGDATTDGAADRATERERLAAAQRDRDRDDTSAVADREARAARDTDSNSQTLTRAF